MRVQALFTSWHSHCGECRTPRQQTVAWWPRPPDL